MLHVHRASRAADLAEALASALSGAPPDPFAGDVVAVPTRGVERWLTQTLALRLGTSQPDARDGIVAGVAFPSPREIVDQTLAASAGLDPRRDPWAPERMMWPLLATVDEHLGEPWLALLAGHLEAADPSGRRPRRLGAVRHLAHLYDRYAVSRPDMLERWRAGDDVDGAGAPLAAQHRWQAELWRRLRARLAMPGPAERLAALPADLDRRPEIVATLPERLALFGLTRLPAAHLATITAIATVREVHLFVLHPSPTLWQAIADAGPVTSTGARADDDSRGLVRNRLLRSWGRDARELQLVLGTRTTGQDVGRRPPPPTTLLEQIQHDIAGNVDRRLDQRLVLDRSDRSIEVHACHGRTRQVEVLRDVILHALSADPELEPRDIVVMCPDIEVFAPLIGAVFGEVARDGPQLEVRLADRAIRQTNPLLGVLAHLLELEGRRLTRSDVLELAGRGPVRRRFSWDDDDLETIERWAVTAGARWGLDRDHRATFGLGDVAQGTWSAALDRILTGVAVSEDGLPLIDGVLPLDDVDGAAIDLAGRLAEYLERLTAITHDWTQERPLAAWCEQLAAAATALTATAPSDLWQELELTRLLTGLSDEAAGSVQPLTLAELRTLVARELRGRPSRASFRSGHLTFCTLNPMRSVPHRMICLLGLDDRAFPRRQPADGDDLIAATPRIGDHDPRSEDRQLLLDAVLAAERRLVILYAGADERTNAPLPPAVPVGELLDAIDRTATTPGGEPAATAVTVRHPLQSFDPRVFTDATLGVPGPFGHDEAMLAGARASISVRHDPPPFLSAPLDGRPDPIVELDDLVRFFAAPVATFLRRTLGVSVGGGDAGASERIPVTLDGLERWAVGDRVLAGLRRGEDRAAVIAAERARGTLPPGRLGDELFPEIGREALELLAVADRELAELPPAATEQIAATLPGGRTVVGTVEGVHGDLICAVSFSRLRPPHRLAAWLRLLALTATDPERPLRSLVIGRRGAATVAPLGESAAERSEAATAELARLLDLLDRGLREPPPLTAAASEAFARGATLGRDAGPQRGREYARSQWTTPPGGWEHEDRAPEHVLVHGGVLTIEELFAERPHADELAAGFEDAGSRFGSWALRAWSGLLRRERIS